MVGRGKARAVVCFNVLSQYLVVYTDRNHETLELVSLLAENESGASLTPRMIIRRIIKKKKN
jgi:hypothetical protein